MRYLPVLLLLSLAVLMTVAEEKPLRAVYTFKGDIRDSCLSCGYKGDVFFLYPNRNLTDVLYDCRETREVDRMEKRPVFAFIYFIQDCMGSVPLFWWQANNNLFTDPASWWGRLYGPEKLVPYPVALYDFAELRFTELGARIKRANDVWWAANPAEVKLERERLRSVLHYTEFYTSYRRAGVNSSEIQKKWQRRQTGNSRIVQVRTVYHGR